MAPTLESRRLILAQDKPWTHVFDIAQHPYLLALGIAISLALWAAKHRTSRSRHPDSFEVLGKQQDHHHQPLLTDLPLPLRSVIWHTRSDDANITTNITTAKDTSGTLAGLPSRTSPFTHNSVSIIPAPHSISPTSTTISPTSISTTISPDPSTISPLSPSSTHPIHQQGPWRRHSYPSQSEPSDGILSDTILSDETRFYQFLHNDDDDDDQFYPFLKDDEHVSDDQHVSDNDEDDEEGNQDYEGTHSNHSKHDSKGNKGKKYVPRQPRLGQTVWRRRTVVFEGPLSKI